MRPITLTLALAALALTLAACGGADRVALDGDGDHPAADDAGDDGGNGRDARTTDDDPDGDGDTAEAVAITGALAGDPHLEGGDCVWVETDEGSYQVRWPAGWQVDTDPVELVDPDGAVVARGGDPVRVRGAEIDGLAGVCQTGTLFEATEAGAG